MKKITLLGLCTFFLLGNIAATTYYVDASRPDDTGTGTTWASAFQTIATAYGLAQSGDYVWVKAGDYSTAQLTTKNGVAIYGGFSGTETALSQRAKGANPWDFTNATIVRPLVNATTNRIFESGTTSEFVFDAATTIIDGFTFDGILADGTKTGTAIQAIRYNATTGGITLRNSIIQNWCQDYAAASDHGGIRTTGPDCVIEYCLFQNNKGKNGGGVYIERGTLRNSTIRNNRTRLDGTAPAGNNATAGNGGGVFVLTGGKVYGCLIENNEASYGGGVFMGNSATDLCYNNVIINNQVSMNGAGIAFDERNATGGKVYNVTVVGNKTTAAGGGGVYFVKNNSLYNSILCNNGDAAGTINNTSRGSEAFPSVKNNILETGNIFLGDNGNIASDSASVFNANYTLKTTSPALNAGYDVTLDGLSFAGDVDYAGNARVQDGTIDIGAYEGVSTTAIRPVKTATFGLYPSVVKRGEPVNFTNPVAGLTVKIADLSGHTIQSGTTINTARLTPGLYLVELKAGATRSVVKLLVK
ncbi:MAG: hypothetical protein LBT25_03695 [Candidatus Symbiothrix sp.]|jgi:hypothetical protein|nr:hypothetical protein [Candidatus Symbiothrix sp.]